MLISPKNIFTDTSRIMCYQLSGYPMAQSRWYIKLTFTGRNETMEFKSIKSAVMRKLLLQALGLSPFGELWLTVWNTPQRFPSEWWGNWDIHLPFLIWHVWGMFLVGGYFLELLAHPVSAKNKRLGGESRGLAVACLQLVWGWRGFKGHGWALPLSAVLGKWHMPGQPQCPFYLAMLTIGQRLAWTGSIRISPGINLSWLLNR